MSFFQINRILHHTESWLAGCDKSELAYWGFSGLFLGFVAILILGRPS